MGLLELFLIAVGLSMDAFAVSVCKGLSVRTLKAKHAVICGLYFGGFQLLMPLIGFALGVRFQSLITSIDHWIAFVLLGLIGDRFENRERQRFFSSAWTRLARHVSAYSQSQIPYCYTGRLLSASATQGELPEGQERGPWGILVSRNSSVWR